MKTLNPLEPNPRLRYEYDRGSGYEAELRLSQALSALVPTEHLIHPDHRLFQVTHLITEFAWVGIHHSLCDAVAAVELRDPVEAGRLLRRATEIAAIPVSCVRLLVDFLPQTSFLRMRDHFPDDSTGLDSPGARGLRKAAHALWGAFETAVSDQGMMISDLAAATEPGYRGGAEKALLAELGLGLHRFDSKIMEWKQVHLTMVWQLLGGHPTAEETLDDGLEDGLDEAADDPSPDAYARQPRPTSMRGKSISDLERLAVRPLFPKLWLDSTARYRSFNDAGTLSRSSAEPPRAAAPGRSRPKARAGAR